jgi:hypothetical protein
MIINNTPNVICRGMDTHTYTHKYSQICSPLFRDLPARRQRWQLGRGGQLGSGSSDGGGKKKQSTKSSGGNSDGNGDDDSNDNDNENKGNGVVDGSVALAVAAGRWRQKRGGGGQRDQYIPDWNCLLFN